MPLTPKGRKIEGAMEKEYGAERGKQVFYASKNKGTITGVEGKKKRVASKMPAHISKIYDDMESRHKKKMAEINSSNRPEWEKEHMRKANSSGIGRFLSD